VNNCVVQVLSLPRDASKADIKKRFFELAKKLHPDVNKDDPKATDKFNEIREVRRMQEL
jgi:molecular chaperone DnaJ